MQDEFQSGEESGYLGGALTERLRRQWERLFRFGGLGSLGESDFEPTELSKLLEPHELPGSPGFSISFRGEGKRAVICPNRQNPALNRRRRVRELMAP